MDKYEFRLEPGTFVEIISSYNVRMPDWQYFAMVKFRCADGSVGVMDWDTFQKFYRCVWPIVED